jgi:hypothetical protein
MWNSSYDEHITGSNICPQLRTSSTTPEAREAASEYARCLVERHPQIGKRFDHRIDALSEQDRLDYLPEPVASRHRRGVPSTSIGMN